MPARNIVKTYVENGHYHIYNRGVEKRKIFKDRMDYEVFLKYLNEYLSPPPDPKDQIVEFSLRGGTFKGVRKPVKNYHQEIDLLAYCLMPNHFHLLVKQKEKTTIIDFLRSLATRYSIYFNKKYNRIGKLFQGHYKGVLISDDTYLLHLSRYIHLNPGEHLKNLREGYSSYQEYLGLRKTDWIKPDLILKFFDQSKGNLTKGTTTYQSFVERYKLSSGLILKDFILE